MTTVRRTTTRAVDVLAAVYKDLSEGTLTKDTHVSVVEFVAKYNVPRPAKMRQPGAAVDEPEVKSESSDAEEGDETSSSFGESSEEVVVVAKSTCERSLRSAAAAAETTTTTEPAAASKRPRRNSVAAQQ